MLGAAAEIPGRGPPAVAGEGPAGRLPGRQLAVPAGGRGPRVCTDVLPRPPGRRGAGPTPRAGAQHPLSVGAGEVKRLDGLLGADLAGERPGRGPADPS